MPKKKPEYRATYNESSGLIEIERYNSMNMQYEEYETLNEDQAQLIRDILNENLRALRLHKIEEENTLKRLRAKGCKKVTTEPTCNCSSIKFCTN